MAGALAGFIPVSVVTAGKHGNEMKQVDKQIEDVQIQANRRADIVGLATVNDTAGIKQDQACHDHHYDC